MYTEQSQKNVSFALGQGTRQVKSHEKSKSCVIIQQTGATSFSFRFSLEEQARERNFLYLYPLFLLFLLHFSFEKKFEHACFWLLQRSFMWTMSSFNRKAPWESTPFPWNTTPSFPSHHDHTKDYRSKESSLSGWRSCIMMKKEWLLAQRLSLPFFDVASVTFGPPVLFSLAFSKHKGMLFMILNVYPMCFAL